MAEDKEHCVVDCRVSDPVQLKGDSLEDQEAIGRRFAERNGWQVAHVFRKPHSATTKERDDFEEVKLFIRKRLHSKNPIRHYICKSIDRITRAGYSMYEKMKHELEELGVEMHDAYGIIRPKQNTLEHLDIKYKWSEFSPSQASEMMENHRSQSEARDILTRMIGAQIRYARDGWATRRAPDGMRNKKFFYDGKERVVREADPNRAPFWIQIFEMRAAGVDDKEIVAQINAMGFRTQQNRHWDRTNKEHPKIIGVRGGKLLTVKQLQRRIMQTEYAGVVCEKWTKHQPVRLKEFLGLVSVDTFNRANRGKVFIKENDGGGVEVLYNYTPWGKVKRLRDNPRFPWKVVACPFCRSDCLGSASRGKSGKKFEAYHCGKAKEGKRAHPYFRVSKDAFEEAVRHYLTNLQFEKDFLDSLQEKLIKKYRQREKEIVFASAQVSRSVADLKAEQVSKLEAFERAQNEATRNILDNQIEELEKQIKDAESKRGQIEISEKSIKGFIRYAKQLMEHPAEILEKADSLLARRALMSLFFTETPTYAEIVNGTPKLQPLFALSEEFKVDKSHSLTLRGIEPRF